VEAPPGRCRRAQARRQGALHSPDLWKSGRACLGWRGNAPAKGQAGADGFDAGQIRQETEERSQARLGVLRLIGNDSAGSQQISPGPLDRFAGCKGKQGKQGQARAEDQREAA